MTTKTLDATRGKILEFVGKSDSRKAGKGFQDEYLKHISFENAIDLVLLYISLQPDRRRIMRVPTNEFLALIKRLWKEGSQNVKSDHFLRLLGGEWLGPIIDIGTAIGSLKYFEWLSSWFTFWNPELGSRRIVGNIIGWRQYSKHFASEVLPKFKKQMHREALNDILVFADVICEHLRRKEGNGKVP